MHIVIKIHPSLIQNERPGWHNASILETDIREPSPIRDILPVTKRTSQEAYALRLVVDVFINKK